MQYLPHGYQGCWNIMNCGREPGGRNSERDGVCISARLPGSACWLVAGQPHSDPSHVCFRLRDGRNTCMTCKVYIDIHDPFAACSPRLGGGHRDATASHHEPHMTVPWLDAI